MSTHPGNVTPPTLPSRGTREGGIPGHTDADAYWVLTGQHHRGHMDWRRELDHVALVVRLPVLLAAPRWPWPPACCRPGHGVAHTPALFAVIAVVLAALTVTMRGGGVAA